MLVKLIPVEMENGVPMVSLRSIHVNTDHIMIISDADAVGRCSIMFDSGAQLLVAMSRVAVLEAIEEERNRQAES